MKIQTPLSSQPFSLKGVHRSLGMCESDQEQAQQGNGLVLLSLSSVVYTSVVSDANPTLLKSCSCLGKK